MRPPARGRTALFALVLVVPGATEARAQPGAPGRAPRGLVRSLGSTAYRHPDPIENACLDPAGRILYTLSDKGVHAWDLQTGQSRLVFAGDNVRNALSLSPDGRRIASIAGMAAGLWDATTGAPIQRFDTDDSPSTIAFPDGPGVILFWDGSIEYRSLDGKESRILGQAAKFCAPVFAPGGAWFAASAPDRESGEVAIYDARRLEKKATLRGDTSVVGEMPTGLRTLRVGLAADGRRAALPAADGSIAIWDVEAGRVVQSLGPSAEKRSPDEEDTRYFLFTPDGQQLFVGTYAGAIRRWDLATGRELAPMRAHRDSVASLHLTPDGARLISTSADGTVRRWDVATGREQEPPDGYSGSLHAQLGPRGETVLLLDGAGRMDIWDLAAGRLRTPIRRPGDFQIESVWFEPLFGFTPDGKRVYVAQSHGKIDIHDADTGRPAGSLALPGYGETPRDLKFCVGTPDGRAFVVNHDTRLRLIRAADGGLVWESPAVIRVGLVFPPVVAGDGKGLLLATTAVEGDLVTGNTGASELVRIDLATGKVVARAELKASSPGSFFDQPRLSADGRLLLVSYNFSELFVADAVATRPMHHHLHFLDRPDLSPDGRKIVGFFSDRLLVYDAATGRPLSRLPIGQQTIQSLHILPDGRHVFTSGKGGHACLWDLNAAFPTAAGGPE